MKCQFCKKDVVLSKILPYCPSCIRKRFTTLHAVILKIHAQTRASHKLPVRIPDDQSGTECTLCVNNCRIHEGEFGYCGVRQNRDGDISGPDAQWAYCDWYHDPLPTNCVADWVCEGSMHHGFKNLAVFFEGCTFNCLFCQNWRYREKQTRTTADELIRAVDALTGCVCFFGGDPTPFAMYSVEVARQVFERRRKVRIYWETNGSASPRIMKLWIDKALQSNGCIKIDFKTHSEALSVALCGSSNKNTKKNIKQVAQAMVRREKMPLLVVSTLLIPGYIDEFEITEMARFLSSVNKNIPWSFLGFYPHFYFSDLPRTSRKYVDMALQIAKDYGIKNTHVGNVHLLV